MVFRWRPLTAEEEPFEYLPGAPVISHWLQDTHSRQAALEMYQAAYGNAPSRTVGFDQSKLVRQIEEAFRRRILLCLRITRKTYSGKSETAEESPKSSTPPPAPRRSTPVRAWIAIELVDDKGKPIPNERFRIELPDGSFAEGNLDVGGHARLNDIDPGTCQVTFPDRDGKEWKPA